jgi:hypothetical protein
VRIEEEEGSRGYVISSPKRHFEHGEIHDEVWDDSVENGAPSTREASARMRT